MQVSCQTHSFFTSPFALSVFSENRLIVGSLFSSADCNVDATCDPASLPQQLSVVQLTHPLTSNFCTGTLIKGPGDKIYILSARHCLTSFDTSFVYPWSSYGVLFNFRLPCGASRVDNITATFSDFLQGLSVVFQDVNSDVAVFELLQDIPPEWNVMLAGWDASNVLNNFTWTDVSQPFGDSQKISTGLVIGTVMSSYFNQDGYVEVSADTDCASPRLQQAPQHTTTVEIASMDKTLISVSPSSVTFTASNWSTPQYVNLTAVDIIPSSESAKSFELSLTWPTVSSSGAKGSRNKTVTGIIRSDVYGTSFYNPVVVDSLPYAAEGSISSFNPQAPFITFANGPFIPGIYFSYTPPVAEASCTTNTRAYYIVAYPATSIVAPGTSHHFQGDFAVGIDALSVEKVMAAFDASSLVASINSIPYGAYATSDTTGLVFYFNPPLSTRVDITTCFNATTVATVVSLLDGETLLPISVSESEGGERCGTLLDQPVTQGQAYLILVTTPPTAVSLSRTPSVVFMSLDISAGAPGAGMEFGVVDPADSVGVGNLTIYQVGDGPAVEQLLGRSVP
ncbi:hypothetical protein F751_0461 [Auxenochlorella protothecoides]|uniref:Peptidase S1 domain-containing protein n=1 Tax=Auxenochlorella protothecoides TaxID=3075 RepID=A0A087SAB1_AUXPR|nr:hypothetical protein F751_0461 [Auxenochlorella protothecoides]KFM22665.1 hypothetical protein F751_0461 [Auxenochlorella protothecoides]